jgi:hypothetical protein
MALDPRLPYVRRELSGASAGGRCPRSPPLGMRLRYAKLTAAPGSSRTKLSTAALSPLDRHLPRPIDRRRAGAPSRPRRRRLTKQHRGHGRRWCIDSLRSIQVHAGDRVAGVAHLCQFTVGTLGRRLAGQTSVVGICPVRPRGCCTGPECLARGTSRRVRSNSPRRPQQVRRSSYRRMLALLSLARLGPGRASAPARPCERRCGSSVTCAHTPQLDGLYRPSH